MQRFNKLPINPVKLLLQTLCALILVACTPIIRPVDTENSSAWATADLAHAPGVLNIQQLLANRLHIEPTTIRVVNVEAVEWPDSCLGAATKDEVCAQGIVPGYQLTLEAQGNRYVYHMDRNGYQLRLAAAPDPQIGEVLVTWSVPNYDGGCRTAIMGAQGVAYGRCNGILMRGELGQRQADVQLFVQTYASFQAETPTAKISLKGQGTTIATPAEQRMLAEWAAIVQLEAGAGRVSAALGNVFAWRHEDKAAGLCEEVTAYSFGDAYVNSCAAEQTVNLGRVRLSAQQLTQLYAWVDGLASFDVALPKASATATDTTKLIFAGLGFTNANQADQAAMQQMALALRNQVK